MSDLTIFERSAGNGVTVLECSGKVTIDDGSVQLRTVVRRLIGQGQGKILLNMAGVQYIDSSGIGELISSFTAVKKEGGIIKMLALTPKMKDLLTITKILTVFDCFDNEQEGIASFHKH